MYHDRQTEFAPRSIWQILLVTPSDHYTDFNDFSGFTGLRSPSVPMKTTHEGGLPVRVYSDTKNKSL